MGKRSTDATNFTSEIGNGTRQKDECWETSVGQELAKLVLFDMYMVIFSVLFFDFFRGLMVRYLNPIWPFWDLEGKNIKIFFQKFSFFRNVSAIR